MNILTRQLLHIEKKMERPSVRGLADLAGVKKNKAEKAMKRVKEEQIA
jgi:DNA-binding transcriptional regulator YhcF (GntR family)